MGIDNNDINIGNINGNVNNVNQNVNNMNNMNGIKMEMNNNVEDNGWRPVNLMQQNSNFYVSPKPTCSICLYDDCDCHLACKH